MGTFLQKTQVGSSNNRKNSISASLSPYRHQLGHFHDLGTRFKEGRRLPFYGINYWAIAVSKQIPSSFIIESQKQVATLHHNHKVTSSTNDILLQSLCITQTYWARPYNMPESKIQVMHCDLLVIVHTFDIIAKITIIVNLLGNNL